VGFGPTFLMAAGIMLAALVITVIPCARGR
jgi:hypothetical protein